MDKHPCCPGLVYSRAGRKGLYNDLFRSLPPHYSNIPTLRKADFPSLPHVQKQLRSRTIYGGFKQAKKATNTCKKRPNCLLEQLSVRKITALPKRENIKNLETPAAIGDGSV